MSDPKLLAKVLETLPRHVGPSREPNRPIHPSVLAAMHAEQAAQPVMPGRQIHPSVLAAMRKEQK